jgi:hypothetical protein
MIVEINDMTTPMLSVIRVTSKDVAYEQMSKIGDHTRKRAKDRMGYTRHNWLQKPKGGRLTPYLSKTKTKILGQRTTRDGSVDNPKSMGNMISSNLMEESGTLIVGGRNKRKKVIYRRDGKIVGTGILPTITRHAQSIIHKLDTGERNEAHGWGSTGSKKKSMEGFKNADYRARGFMLSGFRDATPYMQTALTSRYEEIVGRAVNKVVVKLKPSKRVVA